MSRERITVVVPVRKGSQRVKHKNFKPFANSNLLKIKLDVLKQINAIDEIIVNTDSEVAMKIADEYGVSMCIREDYYASSECNNSEFFQNIAENTDTDYIIYSPCTAPLIKVDTYYDINYDPSNSPNTQDLPDIVSLTYGVSIISKKDMIKYRNVVGKKPLFYKVDDLEAVDVDNPIDFEFAEFIYNKYYRGSA